MNPNTIHKVYFLGIGGIGMSALARYFHAMGKEVSGYDLTPSGVTDDLERTGIPVRFKPDVKHISTILPDKETTLIVHTPAVPADQEELMYFKSNEYVIMKRAEVLGILFNEQKGIAIAGTHGKTSVSSMAACILHESDRGCNAFLGGILKNKNTNLLLDEKSEWVVAEADEFDRSFLQLKPLVALVTWTDLDHMDIYESQQDITETFEKFLSQVQPGGTVILKEGVNLRIEKKNLTTFTYSLDGKQSDFYAKNIRCSKERYMFDIVTPQGIIGDIRLQIPGIVNVENAVAAVSVACAAGADINSISGNLSAFAGVQRRFDIQYESKSRIYIDDYAHHPRELDAVIGSVRKLYPDKKITGVFQPHLYTRTRDFADEFAESLSRLDELILLDIYPAREKPLPGIDAAIIFNKTDIMEKTLCPKENLTALLQTKNIEVLLTMGAGDIDRYVKEIKNLVAE